MKKYRGRKVEIRSVAADPEIEDDDDLGLAVTPDDYPRLARFLEEIGLDEAAAVLRKK